MGSSSRLSLESSAFLRRAGAAAGRRPGSVTSPGLSPSVGEQTGVRRQPPHPTTSFGDTSLPGTGKGRCWHHTIAPRGQGHGKGGVTRGSPGCNSPHSICTKQLCSSSSAAGLITPPTAPGPLHKRCWDKLLGSCSPSILRDASLLPCPSKSQLYQEHTSLKPPRYHSLKPCPSSKSHSHQNLAPRPISFITVLSYPQPLTPLCSSLSLGREF